MCQLQPNFLRNQFVTCQVPGSQKNVQTFHANLKLFIKIDSAKLIVQPPFYTCSCGNKIAKEPKDGLLESNQHKNDDVQLFSPTDSHPQSLSDLPQTSCACSVQ